MVVSVVTGLDPMSFILSMAVRGKWARVVVILCVTRLGGIVMKMILGVG